MYWHNSKYSLLYSLFFICTNIANLSNLSRLQQIFYLQFPKPKQKIIKINSKFNKILSQKINQWNQIILIKQSILISFFQPINYNTLIAKALVSRMSTRAKYVRLPQQAETKQEKPETDIILQKSNTYGKYVGRALKLFFEDDKKFVVLRAAERVIERAIWVAEVLKRKVGGLHQITRLTENSIVDVYEPKEEGLETVKIERFLTVIEITLTKEPTAAEKADKGYQAPLKIEEKEFLTKETWAEDQKKREERRQERQHDRDERDKNRGERRERPERNERRDRDQRPERNERRNERGEERGGERKRGRARE